MDLVRVRSRLEELSELAESRKSKDDMNYLPNHTTIDYLTEEEIKERHELRMMLPTFGEKAEAAKERIKRRIKSRKNG